MAHDPIGAMRLPAFRGYIIAKLLFIIAAQIQVVAVGWQVYSITHDPLSLGFIGLVEATAFIAVALFGGILADAVDTRRIIYVCLFVLGCCSGALCWLTLQIDIIQKWGVYAIYSVIAISGAARGFLSPALFAFMTQLIPEDQYASSSTWNSGSWQLGAVGGPAIGGLLYGFAGITITYLTDAILVVASIVLMVITGKIAGPSRTPQKKLTREGLGAQLSSGLRFVFKNQIMLGAMSLDLFAVLFGGAVALLPVFASEVLKVGPEGLGLLRSAPALGAVLMAVILAFFPLAKNAGRLLICAVMGFGLCMIGFALSKTFALAYAFLFLSGCMDNVSVVVRSTIMQTFTPEDMRGRVSSVNSIFIGSSNEIGAFESGAAAKLLGLIPSVVVGGTLTIVTVIATMVMAPKLLKLDLSSQRER